VSVGRPAGSLVDAASSPASAWRGEVEDLDQAVAGHEEVLRLEVPVDDAVLVGRGQARAICSA